MATAAEHRAEIDRINGEVATQAAKIAQLSTILDGKAGGGGGSVETCTVTINNNSWSAKPTCYYIDAALQKQSVIVTSNVQIEIQKNSYIIMVDTSANNGVSATDNAELLFEGSLASAFYVFGDCTIEII